TSSGHAGAHSCPTRRSSDLHDNQLLMSQERMQALIDMQKARYAAGEISVNTAAMEGYSEEVELQGGMYAGYVEDIDRVPAMIEQDRKGTRLNSSHDSISYAA